MTSSQFYYKAVHKADLPAETSSIIAYQLRNDGNLRAIMWSGRRAAWIYAPALTTRFLFDDQYLDRTRILQRPEAEEIARAKLSTTLPREETLLAMCEEGEQMGWDLGPPRQ